MGLKGREITPKHGVKEKFSFFHFSSQKREKVGKLRMKIALQMRTYSSRAGRNLGGKAAFFSFSRCEVKRPALSWGCGGDASPPHRLGAVAEPKNGGKEDNSREGLNEGISGVPHKANRAVDKRLGKDVERMPEERATKVSCQGAASKERKKAPSAREVADINDAIERREHEHAPP